MFFLTPRYIKEAGHLSHAAKKLLHYRRDLWTPDQVTNFERLIAALKKATKERNREEVEHVSQEIQEIADRYSPPPSNPGWRENCEVIIIAIIVAAGIRTYFLQPFKIPTGSMQPTLHGVVGYPTETPPPNALVQAFEMLRLGRSYFDITAKSDETIIDIHELPPVLHFFTFTQVTTNAGNTYKIFAPYNALRDGFGLLPGKSFNKGDAIVHGYVDTGDMVFVNKFSYNFVLPKSGNVFVFKTTGIRGIENSPSFPQGMGSEHYIKRLAGLPGYTLRIDPPNLYINGQIPNNPAFLRVMSQKNGYRGYSNGTPGISTSLTSPTASVTVPPKCYFALGDNSYNSSDSRYWGFVPEENVAGKGFIVLWPFSKRWGFIH